MKITPVFSDPKALPIWKLEDVVIPKFIQGACLEEDPWISYPEYHGWIGVPGLEQMVVGMSGRYLHKDKEYCDHKFKNINEELVEFLKVQQDYDFNKDYPVTGFQQKLEHSRFRFDTVRDNPGFRQTPHVDNRLIMCTALINLSDNDEGAGTYYYDYFDFYTKGKQTLIYTGPSKKGTGLLHVNTCVNLHEGWNNTESNRFIAFGNIGL